MIVLKESKWTSVLLRLEYWAVAALFVTGFCVMISNLLGSSMENPPYRDGFDQINLPFNYYKNYFIPVVFEQFVFMGAFWMMNFYIVPALVRKEALFKNFFFLGLVYIALALADALTDLFIHAYRYVENSTVDESRLELLIMNFLTPVRTIILFAVYTLLKYTVLYFVSHSRKTEIKNRFVQPDAINAFIIWLISMFLLLILQAEEDITLGWGIIAPAGILLYCFSFYSLIPNSIGKSWPFLQYLTRVVIVLVIFIFPVFMVAVLSSSSENTASGITTIHFAFQLVVTAPLSWFLFKRYMKANEELYVLQKELGRSTANLDFLRSQINPHFLFNALNTLYGTAIQEKADRTSEGIQKLGDMMRFMLQENVQEKIPLSREVEYLNNYISLQKLRTDPNPNITIETNIVERFHPVQIAPMLLIPFVENAFKHGISFREPSDIKISLEMKENTLYFDVANSKHTRTDHDPEKGKSGIGLENVKQRLKLLYPDKHELMIRETAKNFFVHLTIQLPKFG